MENKPKGKMSEEVQIERHINKKGINTQKYTEKFCKYLTVMDTA
jgi:hypothetical protein